MSSFSANGQQSLESDFQLGSSEENEPPILAWSILQNAVEQIFRTKSSHMFYEEIYRFLLFFSIISFNFSFIFIFL